jgi:peptidoglycan hydrolase-like protein with peptidoglycan-binding domain
MTRSFRPQISILLLMVLAMTLVVVTPKPAHGQSLLYRWIRGAEVAEWQQQLNRVRADDIEVDGIFGPVTERATRDFQRSARLRDDDGIVGPRTRRAMQRALAGDAGSPPDSGIDSGAGVLERGDRGPQVQEVQARLRSLRYWVGPVDGIYGTLTRQAVIAFQKLNGLDPDGMVAQPTRDALANPKPPEIRSGEPGLVVEVNKPQQVLITVVDGQVSNIWNTSTGTDERYTSQGRQYVADTPGGRWEIYRQIDGWRESHLGRLYRPKYFHVDGIAIHGYHRVPAYPASHGCVRVSMAAMDYLWPRLPVGTPVLVY